MILSFSLSSPILYYFYNDKILICSGSANDLTYLINISGFATDLTYFINLSLRYGLYYPYYNNITFLFSGSATDPTRLLMRNYQSQPHPHNSVQFEAFEAFIFKPMATQDRWLGEVACTSGYSNYPTIKGLLKGSHTVSCGVETRVQHLGCGFLSTPVGGATSPPYQSDTCKTNLNSPLNSPLNSSLNLQPVANFFP